MKDRNFKFVFIAVLVSLLLVFFSGLGFVFSRVIRDTGKFPFGLANKAGDRIAVPIRNAILNNQGEKDSENKINLFSIFVPITGTILKVPAATRTGAGGALTSADQDVILITHDGEIYGVNPEHSLYRTNITAPENGFKDYLKIIDDPRYEGYQHNTGYFRYNDIQYIDRRGMQSIVVSYTKFHKEKECYTTSVAELELASAIPHVRSWEAGPDHWKVIFETAPCLPLKREWRAIEGHMAGGRLAFDGNETIYLASGDYAWDGMYGPKAVDPNNTNAMAQDPVTDYGKVIRINLITGAADIISRGHRNTQGIALDEFGNVWTVEHGPRGGDELNRIEYGLNFGWPLETYGTLYSSLRVPNTISIGRHDTFTRPIFAWLPSIGISGLAYSQGFHETWDGDMLAATLKGQKLVRIRIREGRAIFAEEIDVGMKIRYVLQHTDGQIVLWTDDRKLIFLSPSAGGLGYRFAMDYLSRKMDKDAGLRADVTAALTQCIECHSLEAGDHKSAPSLAKIYGSVIGRTPYEGYSDAMKAQSSTWSGELLAAFLQDPDSVVPGSIMPNPELRDAEVRSALVEVLEALATTIEIPQENR